jgi:tellurite resistance-related uncharacterized protein
MGENEKQVTKGKKEERKETRNVNRKKNNNKLLIGIVCLALLAVCGIGFGIWAVINGNAKEVRLNEEIGRLKQQTGGEGLGTGNWLRKPNSADEIESIYITYNGSDENIDVLEDAVEYYAYNEEGEIIEDSEHEIEMDTSEIMQFVFDNGIDDLTEHTTSDDYEWSIEVDSPGRMCAVYGAGEYPEWFKNILNKLNVSENGNYLKK